MADEEDFLYGGGPEAQEDESQPAPEEARPTDAAVTVSDPSGEHSSDHQVQNAQGESDNGLNDLDDIDDNVGDGGEEEQDDEVNTKPNIGGEDPNAASDNDPDEINGVPVDKDKNRDSNDEEEDDDDDDDDDDDNIQISIDQNKIDETRTSYQHFGIKSSTVRTLPGKKEGKFSTEEFDQVGAINGTPVQELDMESLEEKPWKKPGADITDYFNYGFTEDTWQAYIMRQRKLRNESGLGMAGYSNSIISRTIAPVSITGLSTIPKTLPTVLNRAPVVSDLQKPPPAPGPISVLTGDKRPDYPQKVLNSIDFSVPPPGMPPPTNLPPPNFEGPPPASEFPADDPFGQSDFYTGGYEPTMESQWDAPPSTFSAPPPGDAPPGDPGYEDRRDVWRIQERRSSRDSRDRDRDRDRHRYAERERGGAERDRDRERDRKRRRTRSRSRERHREHRDRERSERRERERDRDSTREGRSSERRSERKSRSRSPSHRSSSHKRSKRDKRVKEEIKEERPDD